MLAFLVIFISSICIHHVLGTLLDNIFFDTFYDCDISGKPKPGFYHRIESVEEKISSPNGHHLKKVIRGTVPTNWSNF